MAGHIPSIRTRERLEAVAATMAGTHPSEMRQTIEEWEADADPNAASSSELSEQAFDLRMQMLGFSELEITQQVPD